MKFPEHLDHEDMRLAMKEWQLAGCYVEKNRGGLKGHWPQDTDVVYIREDENRHQMLAKYVYYDGKAWELCYNPWADGWKKL